MSDIGGIITSAFRSNQSAESAGVSAAKQLIKLLESKKTTAVWKSLSVIDEWDDTIGIYLTPLGTKLLHY